MKQTTIILFIALSMSIVQTNLNGQAKENLSLPVKLKMEPVSVGYSFQFHSAILNEDRTVMISLPDDYYTTTKKYPVLYMPDGQWHFIHTTQAVGVLSGNGIIPKMIIVAVQTLDNRSSDLGATPDETGDLGGGVDNFLDFMKKELIPFVEKNYRTYPYRLLSGSSLGGIFTVHTFLKDPEYFNAYLAYSPSMWWENQFYVKKMDEFLSNNPGLQNYFYINVANEGLGMGVNALAEVFKNKAPEKFIWQFEEYPQEIHETTAYKATFNGLKFVFSDWHSQKLDFSISGYLLKQGDALSVAIKDSDRPIHYTLDGSIPTIHSPLYEKPIVINKPTTVKALSLFGMNIPGDCDSLNINYLQKFNAVKDLPELRNGLNYSYYEGNWDKLPKFENLTPARSGIADSIDMSTRKMETNFAFRFTGYLDIPEDNAYKFYLSSDDGSQLILDHTLIIDNDGLHGTIMKENRIFLHRGKHPIEILFLQGTGGFGLLLEYESQRIAKGQIPAQAFYVRKN